MSRMAGPTRKTLAICATYRMAIASGESERDVVGYLSADHGVLRPAIWKALRKGGVLPPYGARVEGGRGRPNGGGLPGYSERRRRSSWERMDALDKALTTRVDREPCPRCGTRADFGCTHQLSPTDAFAEELSIHGDVARASIAIGQLVAWGDGQLEAICARLGAQAA